MSDLVTVVAVCALGLFIVLKIIGFVIEPELPTIRKLLEGRKHDARGEAVRLPLSICAAILTLCACLLTWDLHQNARELILTHQALRVTIRGIPDLLDHRLAAMQDIAQASADSAIADTRHDLFQRVDTALVIVAKSAQNADSRTGEALSVVKNGVAGITAQTADLNRVIKDSLTTGSAAVAQQQQDLSAALKPMREAAEQVNEALPYILDCDPSFAGGDCAPNKYLELTHDAENTLHAVSKAAPSVASDVTRIADDATREADALTKPQSIWAQIRTWLLLAAKVGSLL